MRKPDNAVFIALASADATLMTLTLMSIFSTTIKLFERGGYGINLSLQERSMVVDARNILATRFLAETNCSHLMFVDNDMAFDGALVNQMLDADCDIIGATCTRRSLDMNKVNGRIKEFISSGRSADEFDLQSEITKSADYNFRISDTSLLNKNGPISEVEGVGTGLMLIKRRVLEAMVIYGAAHSVGSGAAEGMKSNIMGFFNPLPNPHEPGAFLSEDYSFCHRYTSQCGGKVHALLDCELGHIGDFTYRGNARKKYMG